MSRRPIVVLVLGLIFSACGGGSQNSATNAPSAAPSQAAVPSSPSPQTEFERDLQFIRNGGYTYVYILSRKDGKQFEPADSDFLRKNAPQFVDVAKTDGGKKFIAGTNFNLEEGNLAALKKRFNVEDYSAK